MNRVKILYGVEATDGGVLKHLLYLTANLDKNKFDVTVALSNLRQNISREIEFMRSHDVKVIIVPMVRPINLIRDFISFLRVFKLIRNGNFDVVHSHSSKAGAIFTTTAWINRVPEIIYTPHCFYFQAKSGFVKKIFILIERFISNFYTALIVSDSEYTEVKKWKIAPIKKVYNINNAINFDEYKQLAKINGIKAKLGLHPGDLVVGAIGRLTRQKDWYTYVYAAKEIVENCPNVKFLIVGDGELESDLRALLIASNLQDKVILTGYVKEISRIYSILDVFVSTSLWEGLPYVFLEAMYYQLPIVATDTGNATAVISGETGYVTKKGDFEAVAQHVLNLIEDRVMCAKMGYNGLLHLKEKYSFDMFIKLHQQLYFRKI